MRYDQWIDMITHKVRSGLADEADDTVGDGGGVNLYGSMHSYSVKINDNVRARITNNGLVAIYTNAIRNPALGRTAIYVNGFVLNGKQYTAYTYQCRPGTFDQALHSGWNSPIKLRSCRTGTNPLRCVAKLGVPGNIVTVDYVVPTMLRANYPSFGNPEYPWVVYDEEGNLCDQVGGKFSEYIVFGYDVKRSQTHTYSYDIAKLVNRFVGSCAEPREFYDSIPSVMQQITGRTGSKSMIKDTMLLAAKAHKAALDFQKHVPSAEIHLLPMRTEQQALGDCRFSECGGHDRFICDLSFYGTDYSQQPSCFSSTTSAIHYLGDAVAGNGCMMPSVVLTWPLSQAEIMEHKPEPDRNPIRSVVMTIPPVGLSNLGHGGSVFHLTQTKHVKRTDALPLVRPHYQVFGDGKCWLHGFTSRARTRMLSNAGDRPYELVTPASTFCALRGDLRLTEGLANNYDSLFGQNHSGSAERNIDNLYSMTQGLFDFTDNQELVAIEYHHPTKEDNLNRFPRAMSPERFLDGLVAEATLQSMPLC